MERGGKQMRGQMDRDGKMAARGRGTKLACMYQNFTPLCNSELKNYNFLLCLRLH
jgi:hypothetical protein